MHQIGCSKVLPLTLLKVIIAGVIEMGGGEIREGGVGRKGQAWVEKSTNKKHHFEISVHHIPLSTSFAPLTEPQKKRKKKTLLEKYSSVSSAPFTESHEASEGCAEEGGGGGGDVQQREILKYDPDDVGIRSCSLAKQAFLIGRPPTPPRSIWMPTAAEHLTTCLSLSASRSSFLFCS